MKTAQLERTVIQALRDQIPVRDLPMVRISNVRQEPKEPFDVSFQLQSGKNRVRVLGEIKESVSPKLLEEIAPWIRRMKSLRQDVAFAIICPALSPQSQEYCLQNSIDFLDLAGNISINVPGKFMLQRLGIRTSGSSATPDSARYVNVFSGRSSRILRVLLQKRNPWTLTEIAKELEAETKRLATASPDERIDFVVSPGSISKALSSLEQQLWIRRKGSAVVVTEPRRLLTEWAEKYKERYRWRLRSSFQTPNPFGADVNNISDGLRSIFRGLYAFTGAAAATGVAPIIDIDRVEIFLASTRTSFNRQQLIGRSALGPKLRFTYPYDSGVFMYSRIDGLIPTVSNIQAYLDLYALGGRDLKQADYLLTEAIEPSWMSA